MILAMFGGAMVPLLFLPNFMKTVSHASPVKWGIVALEGAIWRDFTVVEMLLPCTILLCMGSACLAGGILVLSRAKS